jgi:hypothetical protein
MIKKITLGLVALALITQAKGEQVNSIEAVITFYFPDEEGGELSCDRHKLQYGDCAVDFSRIPKGSRLNLDGIIIVNANDCGGRDVLSRKAAKLRGYNTALVIDVWVPNRGVARKLEKRLKSIVKVRFEAP